METEGRDEVMIKNKRLNSVLHIVVLAIGLFLAGTVLSACGKDDVRHEAEVYFDIWGSYNREGMMTTREGFAYFTDALNGESVCVCSKPDCNHLSGDCDGYVSQDSQFLFMNETNEFFLYRNMADDSYSLNDMIMMKADRDGRNRKTLAVLEDAQTGIDAAYDDGCFAICYCKTYDFDESKGRAGAVPDMEKYKAGLYLIDTDTGKCILADEVEGYDAMFCKAAIKDGKVYYMMWYCDCKIDYSMGYEEADRQMELYMHKSLCCYDIKSGKKNEFWAGSNEEVKCMGSYFIIKTKKGIRYYDGEEEMKMLNSEELNRYIGDDRNTPLFFFGDEACFFYYGKGYLYNMETGEISSLAGGRLDDTGIQNIEAVTDDMIYFYGKFEEGRESVGNLYVVSKEDFFRGDISKAQKMTDWK